MIIALEGIDAAGKQTQAARLVVALRARGLTVCEKSFPDYTTETGALIKKLLRQERELRARGDHVVHIDALRHEEALVLQALMTANRYESIRTLRWQVEPTSPPGAPPSGAAVLDRYWASGYAYGTADGIDSDWLLTIHDALPQPDLTVLCDITVEESFRRRPVREDAYEASRERLELARRAYHQLAGRDRDRWLLTDPSGTADSVHAQIMERVGELLTRPVSA